MWLVKFCFSNLLRERLDSEKFHDQMLRRIWIRTNTSYLSVKNLTWKKRKSHDYSSSKILSASLKVAFNPSSKMSPLLLINGRRYDFGVNHGNVFQILRHFWLDKSVLFFILHQSERRIEYGVSPANCICLWFLFVDESLDFRRYKICDRWFSFTTLTPGLASK